MVSVNIQDVDVSFRRGDSRPLCRGKNVAPAWMPRPKLTYSGVSQLLDGSQPMGSRRPNPSVAIGLTGTNLNPSLVAVSPTGSPLQTVHWLVWAGATGEQHPGHDRRGPSFPGGDTPRRHNLGARHPRPMVHQLDSRKTRSKLLPALRVLLRSLTPSNFEKSILRLPAG